MSYADCTNEVALNACNGANRDIYEVTRAIGIGRFVARSAGFNTEIRWPIYIGFLWSGVGRMPRCGEWLISAQEAYRIGLVNEVVPAEQLIPRAEALLRQISANASLSVRFAIEAVNKGPETSQAEGLALESSFFGICTSTVEK